MEPGSSNPLDSISKETEDSLQKTIMETLHKLIRCWNEMYSLQENETNKLIRQFEENISVFLKEMLDYQTAKRDKLRNEVQRLKTEKTVLENELNIKIFLMEEAIACMPLKCKKEHLEKTLEGYVEVRNIRLRFMSEYMQKINSLSLQLGEEPQTITDKPVPSESDLNSARSTIAALEDEKINRITTVTKLKDNMSRILSELKLRHNSFENWNPETIKILTTDKDNWPLSTDCIRQMQEYLLELEIKLDEENIKKDELMDKLKNHWTNIRENDNYINDFIASNKGVGKAIFEKINAEIERCLSIRKDNIVTFILFSRTEIKTLWDKMTFTTDKREKFKSFNINLYNEEILTEHENYLSYIKVYYNRYKDLHSLLEERDTLWTAWVQMETRTCDKGRYKNRGGELLKEEKERRHLEKMLSKIENAIVTKSQNHLTAEGEPFLWNGQDAKQMIESAHMKLKMLKRQKASKFCPQEDVNALNQLSHPDQVRKEEGTPSKTCVEQLETYSDFEAQIDPNMRPVDIVNDGAGPSCSTPPVLPEVFILSPDDDSIICISSPSILSIDDED